MRRIDSAKKYGARRGEERRNGPRLARRGDRESEPHLDPQARRELTAIAIFALALISVLSLFSLAGTAGTVIRDALAASFGLNRYLAPILLAIAAAGIAWPEKVRIKAAAALGVFLFLTSSGALFNTLAASSREAMLYVDTVSRAGGYAGLILSYPLMAMTSFWASISILAAMVCASVVIATGAPLRAVISRLRALSQKLPKPKFAGNSDNTYEDSSGEEENAPAFTLKNVDSEELAYPESGQTVAAQALGFDAAIRKKRSRPAVSLPIDLLTQISAKPAAGDIQGRLMIIQKTLENFGIPVEMGEVSVGPTVTQFTLKPAEGVKLSRITSLSNDLALALAAHPIRIEAPIPGKSLVGIEVPNQSVAVVGLREVLESKYFAGRPSNLTVCLGKDVAGKPWIADLAKMPHLLVAGATGSGKTVCLNSIIISLLYQNNPDDLKFILIDPKRVELPVYNGIPHLLAPAITEVKKTINALKWVIQEMDRRFGVLSESGKRDIAAYNAAAAERMPYLIIIIDELADLMVAAASEVEASIIRLAQMARAVGIHLVVATQRPSVDIITGLIKANITSRIAFSVASATDSRTILDSSGAEKLVGRGDMLFVSSELSKPKRIQCCYVGDNEIRKVTDFLTSRLDEPVSYDESVTEKTAALPGSMDYDGEDDEELYEEAKATILQAGKASASYLQRRLKIGYARAARLLDLLEQRGIIGPGDGAKPRDILVSPVHDVDGAHYNEEE